jgi:hypothetical protein
MEGAAETPLPPAGWYPDPGEPQHRQRYWDGERWTDRFAPIKGHHIAHPQDPPRRLGPFRSLAILGLAIVAVIEAFNVLVDINYIGIGDEIVAGDQPTLSELDSAESLVDIGGISLVVGYLLIGPITFIPWFHRAYSNLPRIGTRKLRYRTGWAIGAWFIPIFNLFRPKQITNDIFRASQPGAFVQAAFSNLPVAPLLHWWWAIFLLQGFLGNAGGRVIAEANEGTTLTRRDALDLIEQEQTGFVITAISSGLGIVAAVLAILVVRRITAAQDRVVLQVTREASLQ